MKVYSQILQPLLLSVLFMGFVCNGQSKTGEPKEVAKTKPLTDEQNKLIVKCSLRDKEGNLWFGTNWVGVFKYDGKKFFKYDRPNGIWSQQINSIYQDQAGNIWLGSKDSVYCTKDGRNFVSIALPAVTDTVFPSVWPDGKHPQSVESIKQDNDGNFWFVALDGGVEAGAYRYDGKNFVHYAQLTDAQSGKAQQVAPHPQIYEQYVPNIFNVLEDTNGNVWFGGRGGRLYRFDGKTFTDFSNMLVGC